MTAATSGSQSGFAHQSGGRTSSHRSSSPRVVAAYSRRSRTRPSLTRPGKAGPATERREFTIIASDYAVAAFGAALARAPLGAVDGLLMPHGVISGFPTVELYRDEWVCVVADDHPDVGDAITLDDLARLPWVAYQRPYDAPAARQLSTLGLEPHVEVSVQSFQLLPTLVAGTRRVALIQRRLAELMAPVARVRVLPCPFEAVPVQEALWWHPVHTQDAAHSWLRETAARVAAGLASGLASGPAG